MPTGGTHLVEQWPFGNEGWHKALIYFDKVDIGKNVFISPSARIQGVNGKGKSIKIGDNCFIGERVVIMCDEFEIGDYGKIHHDTNIHGKSSCKIGHNFWCGQFTIIDATGKVTIGNNVGIGAHSQLWTHIKYGDTLAGCKWNKTKPLTLMDDVWLVGHCIVSPVTAHPKSMALVGSVVTKDMEENQVYAGVPAKKSGMVQFEDVSNEDRVSRMSDLIMEFAKVYFNEGHSSEVWNYLKLTDVITDDHLKDGASYFNPVTRTYTKKGTDIEREFMKFLLPEKAKFIAHVT